MESPLVAAATEPRDVRTGTFWLDLSMRDCLKTRLFLRCNAHIHSSQNCERGAVTPPHGSDQSSSVRSPVPRFFRPDCPKERKKLTDGQKRLQATLAPRLRRRKQNPRIDSYRTSQLHQNKEISRRIIAPSDPSTACLSHGPYRMDCT